MHETSKYSKNVDKSKKSAKRRALEHLLARIWFLDCASLEDERTLER